MTRHYFPRNSTTVSTGLLSYNRVEPVVDKIITKALERVIKEPLGAIGLDVKDGGGKGGGEGEGEGGEGGGLEGKEEKTMKVRKGERDGAVNGVRRSGGGGGGGGNFGMKSPKRKTATDKPRNVLPLCHPETHEWRDGELQVILSLFPSPPEVSHCKKHTAFSFYASLVTNHSRNARIPSSNN